jgi:hypothetical protein
MNFPVYMQHHGHSTTIIGVAYNNQNDNIKIVNKKKKRKDNHLQSNINIPADIDQDNTTTVEKQLSNLIIFDPAHSTQELCGLLSQVIDNKELVTANTNNKNTRLKSWQKRLLKPLTKLSDQDYQLLDIKPGIMCDGEYEQSKYIQSSLA